jgi:hypothetical protein
LLVTSCAPKAACRTERAISRVAAPRSSTAEAMPEAIRLISPIVATMP